MRTRRTVPAGPGEGRIRFNRQESQVKDVYIVGIGRTPVTRDAALTPRELATAAIDEAIGSAELDTGDVDALYVGSMTAGLLDRQQQLGGVLADYAGLSGVEAFNIEAACASGAAAARIAYLSVAGGIHDVAVICGVERMTHVDRDTVTEALATAADRELESSRGESFLSLNAQLMRAYIQRFKASPEDFAGFSIVAHGNALGNPYAVFHRAIDLAAYLDSRIVVDPLRLYDISPVCNGAAAVVLANANAAAALSRGRPRVRIVASAVATAPVALSRRSELLHLQAVESATAAALAQAGIALSDIDVIELHDAYTIMTALSLEAAGFAAPGTATHLACEGRIALTGDVPISTMGGLKARGHPVGATGVYQLIEAHLQLSGAAGANQVRAAEVALTQNVGGTASTVVNHILRRVD
jgi:acetyl-CoA C-acetyltransferase